MKEWLDLVLENGWAYGKQGRALKGKLFLQALTAGGDDSTYQKDGNNELTIGELTSPYRAIAKLCQMEWIHPFAVLGIHRGLSDETINAHAGDYRRAVIALRDETLDIGQARQDVYLNSNLNSIIRRP